MIKMKLNDKVRRIQIATGIRQQFDILPDDWAIPESELTQRACALAAELSSPMLFAHVHRTYCFGAILAARNGVKFDRELAYVAAVLHDLGLTDSLADKPGSFEWVGAREAQAFCEEQGLAEPSRNLVHDAVALHSSVGNIVQTVEADIRATAAKVHFVRRAAIGT
jgi:HD superfamily phosphodiesterase